MYASLWKIKIRKIALNFAKTRNSLRRKATVARNRKKRYAQDKLVLVSCQD